MDRLTRLCRTCAWIALVSAPLVLSRGAAAAPRVDDVDRSGIELMNPSSIRAVERGLSYLADRQRDDGSFGSGGWSRNVAVCALSGMAFVASGSTPDEGPYGEKVAHCIDFLLNNTGDEGFVHVPDDTGHGPMYGHGFATLFLAETYGMTMRPDMREKLTKAVNLIVDTQNAEGGWRYQPQRRDADISVTICQVMALRSARNAGLYVPPRTIERCIEYVKRSQNADGGFMYMLQQGGPSAFPRTAAGVVALYSAGVYEGPAVQKGLTYLMDSLPRGNVLNRDSHYFYGHYYAVQAMWHAGGEKWRAWYPAIRDELLARQREDGSWMDSICPEYGTAMACIILQMPTNYLPIFQR
ncbi:MAG: terpene cyclase/mutase family protein [Planctomycetia bacterium]|nr:terpene cyclase/mutase family protein [Planctomycetia bacterium]